MIFSHTGRQNGKADYRTRRPESRLENGADKNPETILKPDNRGDDNIIPRAHKDRISAIAPVQWWKNFLKEVRDTARQHQQFQSGLRSLSVNPDSPDYIKPSEHLTVEFNDILHYRGRLYVPKLMIPTILKSAHDSKVAGHFGQEKTIELVSRNFWWPGMDTDITEYIQVCPDCQRDKSRRH